MKHLFILLALGSAAYVSADHYNQPACKSGNCPYQQQGRPAYQGNQQVRPANYQQQGQGRFGYNQQQGRPGYYQQDQRSKQGYSQSRDDSDDQDYDDDDDNTSDDSAKSDLVIYKKAQNALSSGLFSSGYDNIFFDVDEGYITLRGNVDSVENKNKIEKTVKDIDGVKGVTNKITVTEKNSGRSNLEIKNTNGKAAADKAAKEYPQDSAATEKDKILNAKIREKLASWISSKNVDAMMIRTNNGTVLIIGTVDKPEDVEKANYQLKDIEGIKSVDNQLKVKK